MRKYEKKEALAQRKLHEFFVKLELMIFDLEKEDDIKIKEILCKNDPEWLALKLRMSIMVNFDLFNKQYSFQKILRKM